MIDRVRLGHDNDDDTVMEVISSVTVYLTDLLTTVRPARRSSTLAVLRKKKNVDGRGLSQLQTPSRPQGGGRREDDAKVPRAATTIVTTLQKQGLALPGEAGKDENVGELCEGREDDQG